MASDKVYFDAHTSITLPSGRTYSHIHIKPTKIRPYLLFLHGYPGTSYLWRHQIAHFSVQGYGIVRPDLLGYRGSDKPVDLKEYRLKNIQVNASEFLADDLQSNHETPRIVVGKILSVGNGVDTAKIGHVIVTYTDAAYSTIVRANQTMCVSAEGFDITTLAATLPNLSRAVNCTIRAGNVQGGARVLVLPMPLPILGAIAGRSRTFGFRITLVVNTEKEREKELEAIRSLVSEPTGNGPKTVIADNFSPLSWEIWRFMPAMGRFILNDSPVDENPDAVPFRKGASLIATGITALYKQTPSSTGEVLCAAIDILREQTELLVREHEVQDISALKDVKTISESFASLENGVVGYSYGEIPVKIQPPSKELPFSSNATYLLVGCLGGLGRSLTA